MTSFCLVIQGDAGVDLLERDRHLHQIVSITQHHAPGVVDHQEGALADLDLIGGQRHIRRGRCGQAVDVGDDARRVRTQGGCHRAGIEYIAAWRVDAQMDHRRLDGCHVLREAGCIDPAPGIGADHVVQPDCGGALWRIGCDLAGVAPGRVGVVTQQLLDAVVRHCCERQHR